MLGLLSDSGSNVALSVRFWNFFELSFNVRFGLFRPYRCLSFICFYLGILGIQVCIELCSSQAVFPTFG